MRYLTKTRPVNTIDELFDSFFYGTPGAADVYSSFPVDVQDEESQYSLSAELPGFSDDDVDITLNDNLLVITASKMKKAEKADRKKDKEDIERKYLLRERVSRQYKRSFALPKDADRDAIKASLKEGLLNLTIGKTPEAKPVSIKIN